MGPTTLLTVLPTKQLAEVLSNEPRPTTIKLRNWTLLHDDLGVRENDVRWANLQRKKTEFSIATVPS